MSVRMRVNRGATGNRRSGHGLEEPRVSQCSNCSASHLRHHMCSECGHYRGRMVIDITAKTEKKALKQESKRKEMGKGQTEDEKDKEETHASGLSSEELSKKK